jgi:hypothetical protein
MAVIWRYYAGLLQVERLTRELAASMGMMSGCSSAGAT